MAEQPLQNDDLPTKVDFNGVNVLRWDSLAEGDTGAPFEGPRKADRTVQVFGTFDAGTVTIQGSLDGVNWAALTDPQGNDLAVTSAKIETISEVTRYIRPIISGAGGSADITVLLLVRGCE